MTVVRRVEEEKNKGKVGIYGSAVNTRPPSPHHFQSQRNSNGCGPPKITRNPSFRVQILSEILLAFLSLSINTAPAKCLAYSITSLNLGVLRVYLGQAKTEII
jgi:hypothetical protein